MASSGSRIVCVGCGANSFVGADRCWRCGRSLPPPEEPTASQSAPAAASGPYTDPGGQPRRVRPYGPAIGALALIGIAALLLALIVTRRAASPNSQTARLNALKDRLLRERNPSAYGADDADGLESRAQRELSRLRGQLDQMPLAGPGADIRLKAGGRASGDEYNDWRTRARDTR